MKISEACKNCYAEAWAKRTGQKVWGQDAPRRTFGDLHWKQPLIWNKRYEETGQRERVFCASMADVFEDRRDLDVHRERLWELILRTPNLDWLLLTKRPGVAQRLSPWTDDWPDNVWLGTTVENNKRARENLSELVRIPAKVRFISAEPLLEEIDLRPWVKQLHWVITGGESGPRARPACPAWFRSLLLQCIEADVPFHFKQWGDWAPREQENFARARVENASDGTQMIRVGKKRAGRFLDGNLFDGLPLPKLA